MQIKAEKLEKQFLRKSGSGNIFTAVAETDFVLEEGKLTVLMGRSGSGKSTLLSMLAGLLEPTAGKVIAGDLDLYKADDNKRSAFRAENFGIIPQGQTGILSLSVRENILLPYTLFGENPPEDNRCDELISKLSIEDITDVKPGELSGGQIRRMAIARALVKRPRVIFADEPTGDLDDKTTDDVLNLLKDEARAGAAVLLVTHESAAEKFADVLCKMSEGVLTKQ